ncbi:LuxR C-terminal-related transcriptional regulator [Microbacterium karelineae]|uniref:LuxR C-terminal-related transcriptional regulator n=1 Tax=Microbacterium karelineae TaxID=2654283 RepID=UPI0012EAFA82|nr:LuxR C-terminal-related transcriptional regulator [Microbacterium karelineae]
MTATGNPNPAQEIDRVHGAPRMLSPLVPRRGFVAWMARNRRSPAVMVTGPAGQGKTSAMLDWSRSEAARGTTVVWVTLDAEVSQREAFWAVVLHHIATAGCTVEQDLADAVREPPGSMAHVLPALILRQFSAERPEVVLVVDNGDLAADSPLADDLVRVTEQRSSLRVVFATRSAPGRTSIEERLADGLAVCPPDLLLFDRTEIAQLARAQGARVTDRRCDAIHAATGGWPLAVHAELADAHTAARIAGDATAGIGALLVDELRGESAFTSLLPLALAPSVDEYIARRLGASDDTLRLLDACAGRGLGTWEGAPSRRFRFQPVLRDALRHEFTTADRRAARLVYRTLAELLEKRDERLAAFSAAVSAGDWPRVVRFYRRRLSEAAVRSGPHSAAVQRIPSRAQRSFPTLMFAVAHDDLAMGQRVRALRGLESFVSLAESRAAPRGRRPGIDDAWLRCLTTLALRLLGRHDAAALAATRFMRTLERVDDPDAELDAAASMFLSQAAVTHMVTDRGSRAEAVLDEAGFDVLPSRPAIERARVLAMRALVTSQRGELRVSQDLLRQLDDVGLPRGYNTGCTTVPATIASARLEIEHGDSASADDMLERTGALGRTSEFWPLILECAVRARWLRSGPEPALAHLDAEMERGADRLPVSAHISSLLLTLRVDLLLAMGRLAEAQRAVSGSAHRRSRRSALARARIRLASGRAAEAAAIALDAARDVSDPARVAALSPVMAAAELREDAGSATAIAHAETVGEIARRHGVVSPVGLLTPADRERLLAVAPQLRERATRLASFGATSTEQVRLTDRERLVLSALVDGLSVEQTAAHLSVSVNTVKTQRRSLYRKLGAAGRNEAVEIGRRHLIL